MTERPEEWMWKSETFTLPSTHVGGEFKLFVQLPPDHATSGQTYPVVYLLDGNWYSGAVSETVVLHTFFEVLPHLIVVGIGYPTDKFDEVLATRARDLSPVADEAWAATAPARFGIPHLTMTTSGGPDFFRFLTEELFPHIEKAYRGDPADRTLMGHSFGGLMALYALFHQPAAFKRYVSASPSLWWADEATFGYERDYAAKHDDLPVRLFLSAGANEEAAPSHMTSNVVRLAAILKDRKYAGLELEMVVFDGEDHLSVINASLTRGLLWVFREMN